MTDWESFAIRGPDGSVIVQVTYDKQHAPETVLAALPEAVAKARADLEARAGPDRPEQS